MHILVIPSWYSKKNNQVLGSFFKEQALGLKKYGYNVTVAFNENLPMYTLNNFNVLFSKKIKYRLEDSLDTYRYRNYNYYMHSTKRFNNFSLRIEKLLNKVVLDKGKVDLIHFHSALWAGTSGNYIKNKYKIPYVLTEHSSIEKSKYVKSKYISYIKSAYDNADALISVSNHLKNELSRICNRKDIFVIPNFLDGKFFRPLKGIKENKIFTFFSLGFLVQGKGFENLLKACKILDDKKVDFILEIGGNGYLKKDLQKLVYSYNLTDKIKFLGKLSREEVVYKMNCCDSFILTSENETFGVVYIEALACGKFIIATKNGGVEDIINKNNGFLIEKNTPEEISKIMIKAMKSKSLFNSRQIREYFCNNFEKDVVIDKLKDVYNSCLS